MNTVRVIAPKVISETRKLEPVRALARQSRADLLAMRKPVQRETGFTIYLRRTGTR